jgi:3-oxoacyl-[acyl-carrier-protein] synthase-1
MEQAMLQANAETRDIDLILAHATSTQAGDLAEAQAIKSLFPKDDTRPPVCAPKALTGHEFWMAGASQVVYGLIMARGGFVAGHPNLENLDDQAGFLRIFQKSTPFSIRRFLCNASGFGGTNSSLVIESDEV